MSDRLSRSDFLKLVGLGFGGAIGAGFKVKHDFDRAIGLGAWIDTLLNAESGVAYEHRREKLKQAVLLSADDSKILPSFLKFEALQVYAGAKGFVLAEAVLKNFIYGEGHELDLTDLVPQSIRNYPDNLIAPWLSDSVIRSMSDDELRQQWVNYSLGRIISKRLQIFPEQKNLQKMLDENKPFYLEIGGFGTGPNRDSNYGLNRFTQSFSGRVRKTERDSLGWKLSVARAKYKLQDLYDWDKDRHIVPLGVGAAELIEFSQEYLKKFGFRVKKLPDWKSDSWVTVDDRDGVRLQQAGLGIPVPVKAEWEFDQMEFRLPDRFLTE